MIRDNERISRNIKQAYQENKYIVTGRKVYQPHYSKNAGYYASKIYTSDERLTRTGRFYHLTGSEINNLLGFTLVHV